MFFFLPFVTEPAPTGVLQCTPLPLPPAPRNARAERREEDGPARAILEAGSAAVDLLKRTLAAMASSMTALGNRGNALFGQVAAALAYQRIARDTASFWGMFWPGFAQGVPRNGFAAPWIAPVPEPALFGCFGLPGWGARPWPFDPLGAFTQAAGMWARTFAAAAPQRRSTYGAPAPVTATFAFPGFSWTFTPA